MHLSYGACGLRARVQLKALSSLLKVDPCCLSYQGHKTKVKQHVKKIRGVIIIVMIQKINIYVA